MDKKTEKIIRKFVSDYCEIDKTGSCNWYVTPSTLSVYLQSATGIKISPRLLTSFITEKYPEIIKTKRRVPIDISGNEKQLNVLRNIILSDIKNDFENYYIEKENRKLAKKSRTKIVNIKNSDYEKLKKLKIENCKTFSQKIEFLLNEYIERGE